MRGEEKLLTAPIFGSKWAYKGFSFENGSGDICFVEVDAIGISIYFLLDKMNSQRFKWTISS